MLLLEDKRCYAYVYLDPRKPGQFEYHNDKNSIVFDFEPFYVGEGKDYRLNSHLNRAKKCNYYIQGDYKHNKIVKLLEMGLEPIIIKLKENLTKQQGLDYEEILTHLIRLIEEGGPLTNLQHGGGKGYNKSKETKEKLSKAQKKRMSNKENNPMYKKHHTSDSKKKASKTKIDGKLHNGNKNGRYIEIDKDIQNKVCEEYKNTLIGFRALAKKYNIGTGCIRRIFKDNNIQLRHSGTQEGSKKAMRKTILKGENHPMYGKCAYDIWLEKYGREMADILLLEANKKKGFKGIDHYKFIKLNYSYLIDLYFEGKSVIEMIKIYLDKYSIKLTNVTIDKFFKCLNFPKGNLKYRKIVEIREIFIEENKHRIQWYKDNYERLEEEYYKNK